MTSTVLRTFPRNSTRCSGSRVMPDSFQGFDRPDWMKELHAADQDRALGNELVRRGDLTASRLEEAIRQQSDAPGPAARLDVILTELGWVSHSRIEEARRSVAKGEYDRLVPSSKPPVPEEVVRASGDPERLIADYVLVASLGSGGAGEVWKAWDRGMRRWVALKIPRTAALSQTASERFQREALAAGKLHHPGIVPVHAAGEFKGRPYIVMQLIEGETLDRVRLPLAKALDAIRIAALALDHAHAQGVVHRDIKPGNLMVDRSGAVWVVDFGIALLTAGEGRLTATGAVMGTVAYMAPEQARGDASVRENALDVYGLGATLYDLATGHPPFVGESFVDVLHKAAREEPILPRKLNSRLPRDVETVILKAMDRDPGRRYASAGEMAEDLRRSLADEPILARPSSRSYRLRKFLRRNRVGASLGGIAAAALVIASVAGIRSIERSRRLESISLEQERERARYAMERASALALLRETARVSLDAALALRREGANERMGRFLETLESAYRQAVERAPDLAEVDYRMGRMHRAMMNDGAALEFQERALRKDPSYAPALYERSVLLAKKYAANLKKAVDGPSTDEFSRALRTITADCSRLEELLAQPGATSSGITITQANLLAARGILAYYQERIPEASRLLREAVERDPDVEEAWDALARTALQQSGIPEDRRRREAILLYTQGLARDRGYVPLLMGRGSLRMALVADRLERGEDPTAEFAEAEADFLQVLRLNPLHAEAWMAEGDLLSNRAYHAVLHGREAESFQSGAERHFSRALEIDAALLSAWRGRAILRTHRARLTVERGGDASGDWAGALEDLNRFIVLAEREQNWRLADGLLRRGTVLSDRAVARGLADAESRGEFARAEEDFERALRFDGDQARVWSRRGIARLGRALVLVRQGGEASAAFEQAEADFTKALSRDARYGEAWVKRGVLRSAKVRLSSTEPKAEDIVAALSDLTRAIELNKESVEAWTERGALRLWQADREERSQRPKPARDEFAKAVADYSQAIQINPSVSSRLEAQLAPLRDRLSAGEQDR